MVRVDYQTLYASLLDADELVGGHDLNWVAGIIEGEGCFKDYRYAGSDYVRPRIAVRMCDRDVIDTLVGVLGCGSVSVQVRSVSNPRHSDLYCWELSGRAALDLMIALYPLLGERRRLRIRRIIEMCREWLEHGSRR